MSEVEFIKNLMEAQWTESITGRDTDVPEPEFVLEKSESNSRLRHRDVGYVASGGDTNYTPQGFGWTHQEVDTIVAIEYRALDRATDVGYNKAYHRTHGKRTGPDGLQEPDRWDGIAGETTRILLDNRKGLAEWCLIGADQLTIVDNVDTGGKNYYRADVVVGLRSIAKSIDTST